MAQQSNPLVSVIVPVYHTSEYLPQCLESLLNQTLEDLEILCVDDGSSDDSAEIAEEFSRRDSRVRLLRQEHQGVSAARNLGLRHARGTYIAFVDGDDWVEPDMLRTMIASAGETGSDVVVCSAKVHFQQQGDGTRERSLIRSLTTVPGTWEKDSGESVWQCMNRPGTWPFIWNKLISRELLTQKELEFPLGLPLGEDGVFMHLLMHCAGKVNYLPQAFYNYRYQRKDSATVRLFDQEITRFRHHIRVLDAMGRGFDRLGLLPGEGAALLRWALDFLYSDYVHLPPEAQGQMGQELEEVLNRHGLQREKHSLGPIRRNRLGILLRQPRTGKAGRMARILMTKVENRMMKYFRLG